MSIDLKKNIPYLKKLVLYISLYLIVFCFLYLLIGNRYFCINNDSLYQYEIFYKEWIKIIVNFLESGKLNTYSFNMFLGTDFYSSMGYYCIGDIFLPIILLFKNNISIGLLIETILCVYISSILMYFFLYKKRIKNIKVILFISIIYAIGGQAIFYVQNYMFHRFFAFLPLLFIGVEYYLQDRKKIIFILACFILFTQNYYFMYMTLLFLFFYSLVECISNKMSVEQILRSFFELLFSILIGFLLSSIIVLPSMLSIFGNVASRRQADFVPHWELNSIFGIFASILYLNPYGAFSDLFNTTYNFHGSWYNLFITIIPFGYVVSNIFDKKNEKRSALLIALFIVVLIKPLNSIMHGFSSPSLRWVFLLEFYLLYLSAIYMDDKNNKKCSFNVLIGIILLNILSIVVLYIFGYVKPDMKQHILFIAVSLFINIIIVYLYIYTNKAAYILSVLFVCLSTIYYYSCLSSHPYPLLISKTEMDYYQNYENTYYRYYNSYLNTYDGSPLDSNSSLLYDIMTTSTYSSTYDTNINRFLELTDNSTSLDWNIEINNHEALTMLGTKYYIVGENAKKNISNSNLEYAYHLKDYQDFDVYYNKDYRGFGYCADNIDYTKNYRNDNIHNFLNTIYLDDDSIDISRYKNLSFSQLDIKYMGDNYVHAEITTGEDNILLIPFPNNKGWNIFVNGSKESTISVNGGFIGLPLNKGFNEIEMRFSTPYLKVGAFLTCLGGLLFALILIQERHHSSSKS